MNRQIRKLILAALISALGFFGTYSWYHQHQTQHNRGENETAVAFVENTKDRSERRAVTRILWQEVSQGDVLYSGEAIRTSATSEIRIQFIDSKRFLELESESLVVIQQSEGEISLDLMEGSVFVKNTDSSENSKQPSLTLNSASGKVDISKATASLSGSSSGKIDLQVIQGSATIQSKKGTQSIQKGQVTAIGSQGTSLNKYEFNLISPQIEKPIFINIAHPQKILFKWKPLLKSQSAQIYIGQSRKTLQLYSNAEYNLDKNEINLSLNPGKYFFKISLNSGAEKVESPTYRLNVESLIPPSFLAPVDLENFTQENAAQGIELKWNGQEEYKDFAVEVSRDTLFTDVVFKKTTQSNTSVKTIPLPAQNYYARISGKSTTTGQTIQSKTLSFFVQKKPEPTPEPKLVIEWGNNIAEKILYHTEKPILNLDWTSFNSEKVKKWNVRIVPEGQDVLEGRPVSADSMQINKQLEKPGRYIAMVEAVNSNDQVIGSSSLKKIEFQKIPLLNAPKILPIDQDLLANQQGEFLAEWENLVSAKEYQLILMDQSGKNIYEKNVTQSKFNLTKLMPGQYQMIVTAIDQYGRKGQMSEPRPLIVPNESGLRPPKASKIRIMKGK